MSVLMGDMKHHRGPFREALKDLMAEKGVSLRDLEQLTREAGHKIGHARIGQLTLPPENRRSQDPTLDNIRHISRALKVEPEYFREYREHRAAERAKEITAEVGLDAVITALEALRPEGPPRRRRRKG